MKFGLVWFFYLLIKEGHLWRMWFFHPYRKNGWSIDVLKGMKTVVAWEGCRCSLLFKLCKFRCKMWSIVLAVIQLEKSHSLCLLCMDPNIWLITRPDNSCALCCLPSKNPGVGCCIACQLWLDPGRHIWWSHQKGSGWCFLSLKCSEKTKRHLKILKVLFKRL